jgi:hypothetical protein
VTMSEQRNERERREWPKLNREESKKGELAAVHPPTDTVISTYGATTAT